MPPAFFEILIPVSSSFNNDENNNSLLHRPNDNDNTKNKKQTSPSASPKVVGVLHERSRPRWSPFLQSQKKKPSPVCCLFPSSRQSFLSPRRDPTKLRCRLSSLTPRPSTRRRH
mmetsp:Transcript_24370/g.75231  ORF Transcript_24370/g.75231 Transcript_24370/m.75231 type:complete len:114 (+) Transcript_24370:344-685(+)